MSSPHQKTKDFADIGQVDERLTNPIDNPLPSGQGNVDAAKHVFEKQSSQMSGTHSQKAQRVVFAKGVFDVALSLSLLFFPALLYDGFIPSVISKLTTLPISDSHRDPQSAFGMAALIMGAGVASIAAAESASDDAFKVIATLNGVFAGISLLGCLLSPYTFGSSFLLLVGLQDLFWFASIARAGRYDPFEILGLSCKPEAITQEEGGMKRREKNTASRDKHDPERKQHRTNVRMSANGEGVHMNSVN